MQPMRRVAMPRAVALAANGSRSSSADLCPPARSPSAAVATQPTPVRGSPLLRTTVSGRVALTALSVVALICAASASADPTAGHDAKVKTQTPQMLCEIGSEDADPGIGPSVICQRGDGFAQASSDADQAFVTASGQFSYRSANIGVGYPHAPFDTLLPGQTYEIQGWTVAAGGDGIRFTNDGTGHGMFIGSDTTVNPF
jgi:hypothetical protein